MAEIHAVRGSEQESREVAEASRQRQWDQPSFLRELFLGRLRLELIHPFPLSRPERPEFQDFYQKLERFLKEQTDPAEIDESGEYPQSLIEGLRRLGAFGMKIPKEYGGLGFSQVEYGKVMQLLGSFDANITALLSAHQSIGVPQPLKLFGTEAQKQKYLPRCAGGEISAFALTEAQVGSDPARLSTTAELTADGRHYLLNGTKLWCTNGTIAKLLVVMARHPESRKISAFVVETEWEGVTVQQRCRFMGLRALANAVITFENVRVPRENLIGEEGRGLKIALTTLNDGRLSIPNASVGAAKKCLEICRNWTNARIQWGLPIGRHEAIAHMTADIAALTFAMESVSNLATEMSGQGRFDIRLEAAAAKEWNTARGWEIIDNTMQIRGGRGYETEDSLASRGEAPVGVERMFRDFRINRIFEGSSEIMHLFMAREAVDKHLQVAGDLVNPKNSLGEKLLALPRVLAFYALWYPACWFGWGRWPRYSEFGPLARHLRFVNRSSRKLARQVFHGMVVYGPRLERKQAFLFRLVDINNELFAMAASISRAHAMRKEQHEEATQAAQLAALVCQNSRRKIRALFRALWKNDDGFKMRTAVNLLNGDFAWLEKGVIPLDMDLAVKEAAIQSEKKREPIGHPAAVN